MDNNLRVGDIVISTSGHDKNKPFIIVSIDKNGNFGIIDGRYRVKSMPKMKNPKHLLFVEHNEDILNKVMSPIVTDAEIFKMIKVYKKVKE